MITLNEKADASVIFTLETSTFNFAQEGEANDSAAVFVAYRSSIPEAFRFENPVTRLHEICSHAMVIRILFEAGKSPTIIGFPSSPLSPEDDRAWGALKAITTSSVVDLWMPTDRKYGIHESLRGTMSAKCCIFVSLHLI